MADMFLVPLLWVLGAGIGLVVVAALGAVVAVVAMAAWVMVRDGDDGEPAP